MKLAYAEFINQHGTKVFEHVECLGVDHLLFSQLCAYYYTNVVPAVVNEIQEDGVIFIESVDTNDEGKIIWHI